jgi:hypothetical protein
MLPRPSLNEAAPAWANAERSVATLIAMLAAAAVG